MSLLKKLFGNKKSNPTPSPKSQSVAPKESIRPAMRRPYGDDQLAHFSRDVVVAGTPQKVWQTLTSTDQWKLWYSEISNIKPGWLEGAKVFWQQGSSSTIGALKEGSELSLVDDVSGTWATWRILAIDADRVRITYFEDHTKTPALDSLRRLSNVIDPVKAPYWEVKLQDGGDTGSPVGPVRLGDMLLAVTGTYIHAVGLDGNIKWSYSTGRRKNPRIPNAYHDVVVYYTLDDQVQALDAQSGNLRWQCKPGGEVDTCGSPALDDARVYVVNRHGMISALDARSGAKLWSCEQSYQYGSIPIISKDKLFLVGAKSKLIAIATPTGNEIWSVTLDSSEEIHGSPAVFNDTVYVGISSRLMALDAENGTTKWSAEVRGASSTPVAVDGKIYIRTDTRTERGVCCIDCDSHEVNWSYSVNSDEEAYFKEPPVVANGVVYCSYFELKRLHAIDGQSGKLLWSQAVDVGATPLVIDKRVYYLDSRVLCAWDAEAEQPTQSQKAGSSSAQPPAQAGIVLLTVEAEVRTLLAQNRKIDAIRLVRQHTNWGLEKAKNYIDQLEGHAG